MAARIKKPVALVTKALARADVQEILNRQLVENQAKIEGLYGKVLNSIETDLDSTTDEADHASARKDYISLLKMHKATDTNNASKAAGQIAGAMSLAVLSEAVKTLKDLKAQPTPAERVIELRQIHTHNKNIEGRGKHKPYAFIDGEADADFTTIPLDDPEEL